MATFENHFKLYKRFKNDAENARLYEGTRVEAYFLSCFHLIEACAAKHRVHINKHQLTRSVLEKNDFIFGAETEKMWRNFQVIENQKRPKFAYSSSWDKEDMDEARLAYKIIEETCLKVLGDDK